MGFSALEKASLAKLIRNPDVVQQMQSHLSEEIRSFLLQNDLMKCISDRKYFPVSWRHKQKNSENISVHWFMDGTMDIYEMLESILDIISPDYRILIDFGFVMQSPDCEFI